MLENRSNQKIPIARLETTISKLDELHKKPKAKFTLRETIYRLRHKLNSALLKGYSYQDLSQILKEQHITISPRTLQQYLADTKRKTTSKLKASPNVADKSLVNLPEDNTEEQDLLDSNTKQKQKASLSNRQSNSKTTSSKRTTNTTEKIANALSGQNKSVKRETTDIHSSTKDLSSEFNQY